MRKPKPQWKVFEDTVRSIIGRHRDFFELGSVESGVTKVRGKSGYEWNIDVAATKSASQGTVIFEVRRRKKKCGAGGDSRAGLQDSGHQLRKRVHSNETGSRSLKWCRPNRRI